MNISRTVHKYFSDINADKQFHSANLIQEGIIRIDTSSTMNSNSIGRFQINMQHTHYIIRLHIAHRELHTIPIVTWKCQCLRIDNSKKPRHTSFARAGGITAMIHGCQKKHISTFNETFISLSNFR